MESWPYTNGLSDMFWYDRKTGKMKLVSVTFDGSDLDSGISEGSVSGDGRFVAFDSQAMNILDNELDNDSTVFSSTRTSERAPATS